MLHTAAARCTCGKRQIVFVFLLLVFEAEEKTG